MIICGVAARAGYAPTGAATYEEAAKFAQEGTFDCITLDLSLGPHAGVELVRLLWVVGNKAPIIVISGCDDATYAEAVRVAKSLNLVVLATMPKPVDLGCCATAWRGSRTTAAATPTSPRRNPSQISPA